MGTSPDGMFGPMTARAIRDYYKLSNTEAAHLLGQCAHESAVFTRMSENLNYSAEGLREVFPRYFDSLLAAEAYAYRPELIANKVYANRMGNDSPGDGWKHRGQGPLQLTGKENQKGFSLWVKDPEVFCDPELIGTKYGMESAIYFFEQNGIFDYCISVTPMSILKVSRAVNLGNPISSRTPKHLTERINWTNKIYRWLI